MPALSNSQGWTNGTFVNRLLLGQAGSFASTMAGPSSPTYYCRIVGNNFGPCADRGYSAPGPYPINFFVPNPYVADLTITDDNSWSTYNGLQLELRRRLRNGLSLTANYAFSKGLSDMQNTGSTVNSQYYRTIRNFALDKAPMPSDIRHTLSLYGTYDLPVGKGRHFAITNRVLNHIVGGWTVSGIMRLTSGSVSSLTSGQRCFNQSADCGVVLNGLSVSQLQEMMQVFRNGPTGTTLSSADPSLVGADGRANPQYLALPTTPGQFGQFIYIYGPNYISTDMSVNKDVRITERVRFTLQAEAMNFLNHPVFGFGSLSINSTSFGQLSSSRVSPRNIQIRAYLRW